MDIFLKGATFVCSGIVGFTITKSYSIFLCPVIDFPKFSFVVLDTGKFNSAHKKVERGHLLPQGSHDFIREKDSHHGIYLVP